jgi:hypothetical protein
VSTRCRSHTRTIFVTAMAVFAIAVAPNTFAQSGAPSRRIVELPDGPTWTVLLENALTTAASQYDPKLPAISLEQWLWSTLAPVAEVPYRRLVDWRMLPCSDPHSETGDMFANLCAMGTVKLSPDRNIQILITVAEADRSITTGVVPLRPTRPSLRDIYIERVNGVADSLDVPTLSDLMQQLTTPFERWPTVDFETTTTWTPPHPAPGDTVRFSIAVRNTSKRTADRAAIDILISPCCSNASEVRHESLQYLKAGQTAYIEAAIPLPEGMAMVAVSVKPRPGHKTVRESDPYKKPSVTPVGYPMTMTAPFTPVITVSCANAPMPASSSCVVSATLSGVPVPAANITITAWDWGDGTAGATGAGFVKQSHPYAAPRAAGGHHVTVSASVPGGSAVGTGTGTAILR